MDANPALSARSSGHPPINWLETVPWLACHAAVVGAFFTEVAAEDWVICFALLYLRLFGITAGYHRYFSHRSFKTSRPMQFLFAFLAQTSAQKGALWWAAHHRAHHKYSDQPGDLHSPARDGFWYAHCGWLFAGTEKTDWDRIKDFAKYPELRWLNKYFLVPPVLLAVGTFLYGGWGCLFIGFFLSTVFCWHSTFIINSLTHVYGSRRFETTDTSRNSLVTALLTLGEGWHNNHHHYQSCVRQGFYWWEIDVTYYALKAMSWVGLVWDLREPPAHVLAEGRRLDRERRRARRRASPGAANEAPSLEGTEPAL